MVEIYLKGKAFNHFIASLGEVQREVQETALDGGVDAERRLAAHRDTGAASVSVTEGDIDAFINLDDPNALSIEFGHLVKGKYERDEPKYVPGLYIITGGAGLLAGPKQGPRRS